MGRNSNDQWTAEEDERFLKLRAEGKSNLAAIAAAEVSQFHSGTNLRPKEANRRWRGGAAVRKQKIGVERRR
jgi:hypothetical protein